jgi:hypothetical protein
MMDYRQNVETSVRAEPGNRVENFFFSVCKPLAEKQGLDCPSEAAVCSAQGSLEEGWKVNEHVVLKDTNYWLRLDIIQGRIPS